MGSRSVSAVMPGLVPGIHDLLATRGRDGKTWMAGTSPAMRQVSLLSAGSYSTFDVSSGTVNAPDLIASNFACTAFSTSGGTPASRPWKSASFTEPSGMP